MWKRVSSPALLFCLLTLETCCVSLALVAQEPRGTLRDQVTQAIVRDLKVADTDGLREHLQILRADTVTKLDLRVTGVKASEPQGTWLLRIECVSRKACLPFYAVLEAGAETVALRHSAFSLAPQSKSREATEHGPNGGALQQRSGDHVEVVEEISGLHFKTKGVCLQGGSEGERIRVRNLSTHRVLLAVITGKDVVRVVN